MDATGEQNDLTRLLEAVGAGDRVAAESLLARVYDELRALARSRLSHVPPGQTLQTTALVNEAFVRMTGRQPDGFENRRHFFFAAARAMHDILVEDARRKSGPKAGGGRRKLDIDGLTIGIDAPPEELLALHEVLARLEREDSRKHQIVMLRFFAGLTNEQAAETMGIPLRTFEREWRFVRAKLHKELSSASGAGES
jgi:RNA polymerase sigma factor (TIGR02999 family)